MAASPPSSTNTDLASYALTVDGRAVPEKYFVTLLEVTSELNRIPHAAIELVDGDSAKEDFPISGSGLFAPGTKLSLELGYHGALSQVFSGIVTGQAIRSDASGAGVLRVEAHHAVVKSSLRRKNAVFTQQADAGIMQRLLQAAGVSASVSGSGPTLSQLVQYYATDWDFLVSRAEANGWVVASLTDKVMVGEPGFQSEPVLELRHGTDVLGFELELDALSQVGAVECTAWSPDQQQVISAANSPGALNAIGQYTTQQLADAVGSDQSALQSSADLAHEDLSAWANAEYARRAFAKVRGRVRFQGSKLATPGAWVELAGFGETFNGKALVGGVRHTLDQDGHWTTEITLGLQAASFASRMSMSAPLASGLAPGAQGLLNAVVKATSSDPENNFRVQVEVPLLGAENNLLWARLASFYASNAAGAVFFPEIGDEVIVGFVNGDPRSAIVLGSLYSGSKLAPPWTPDQANDHKGIITRGKLELLFDDASPAINMQTPGGRKLTLDDKAKKITLSDQVGNSLEMSDDGITIKSAKKLTLSAASGVEVSTTAQDIQLAASAGSLKANAMQVQITGDQSFQASGNATATIQSSGQTVVKGTIVMIN